MKGVCKMAITKIAKSDNIGGLIRYIQTDKNDNDEPRILDSVAWGTSLSSATKDFANVRKQYGKQKGYVQGYSMLISWGDKELSAKNDADVEKATEFVATLMQQYYEGHQYVAVVQADGDGGQMHAHVAINAVNAMTGKSIRAEQRNHKDLAQRSDELQRQMGIVNVNADNDLQASNKQTIKEIKMRANHAYVWKDDLKQKIEDAKSKATSVDEYETMLIDNGVEMRLRNSKKTKNGKMITYAFDDADGKQRKARETSLGALYGYDDVIAQIEQNKALQAKIAHDKAIEKDKQKQKRKTSGIKMAVPTVDDLFNRAKTSAEEKRKAEMAEKAKQKQDAKKVEKPKTKKQNDLSDVQPLKPTPEKPKSTTDKPQMPEMPVIPDDFESMNLIYAVNGYDEGALSYSDLQMQYLASFDAPYRQDAWNAMQGKSADEWRSKAMDKGIMLYNMAMEDSQFNPSNHQHKSKSTSKGFDLSK